MSVFGISSAKRLVHIVCGLFGYILGLYCRKFLLMINWEGSGRKLSLSYLGTTPACAGDVEEDQDTVSRIIDVLLARKTEDLPNIAVDCCSYSKLFGFWFPLR